jgi:hypothetical protein
MILLYTKILCLIHDSHSPFHIKMCILLLVQCHCTPTKSNIHPVSSLILSLMNRCKQAFHISRQNVMSIFSRIGRLSQESVQVRGWYERVRFFVFTAVTMKNGVFWDVTQCGSCKNRRFGEKSMNLLQCVALTYERFIKCLFLR